MYSDNPEEEAPKPDDHESASKSESTSSDEPDECSSDEVNDYVPPNNPEFVLTKNDPQVSVGTIYPNIHALRMVVAQHSIKHEFEYNINKSEPGRLRLHCAEKKDGCNWRLHA